MLKPNLFIPGFAKCGTSSLHAMLTQHSEINGGYIKEPHTYSRSYIYNKRFAHRGSKTFESIYGDGEYKYIIDSSTDYSVYPLALERIKGDTPEAKFIVMCRDPLDRIISHYNWMVSLNFVQENFCNEIAKNSLKVYDPADHFEGTYKLYLEGSKYGKYIKILFELFGRDAILVLKYEEVFKNWEVMRLKIAEFLGLDGLEKIKSIHTNKTNKNNSFMGSTHSLVKRIKNTRKNIRYKKEIGAKSKKILIPHKNYIDKEKVDLSFVIEYIYEDICEFIKLGYNLDGWDTTKDYLSKL